MQKIMLIDHGWQPNANWGYWGEADSQRFPNGIKWLSDRLRQCGLDLALWFTPFCVTENCPDIVRLQPLLACTEDGQLYTSYACVWGQLPGQSAGQWPIHFFNGSLEAVQAKWGQELMRMFEEWGCAYWKLDFFTLITSQKERFEVTVGDLYAQTYSNFRKAVGEIGHLAPCSCDTNMQLSYNDSIRIAADIGNAGAWPKELESFRRGLSTIASLWYKHRRFWVNDADSIQVGCGCGLNEARVRATVVAFSGSHLMVSEDLRWVSPDRLEIIRRLLPAYGQAARPIDLFDHPAPDVPHIWQLEVESDWGACNALAIFNLTEEIMKVQVQPDWFGLPTGALFGVIEWWQQRWIGKFDGIFEVIIPPMDVAVLHAQLLKPHPWLISVSHHFTGGLIIENLSFDPEKEQLKGEVVTRPGISMSLMGTVPPGWTIPSDADYHGRCNGDGGWAYEVRTTSQRTPFAIQFSFRR
jgi:hypothetical protein